MNTQIILTVIGDDRPGIVTDLSHTLHAHKGNWSHSSMSHLAGQFAGILLASVPDEHVEACLAALDALAEKGLRVTTHATKESDSVHTGHVLTLEVIGNDAPGIIRQITGILKAHGVSIDDLDTGVAPASMAGGQLFKAWARLHAPEGTDLDDLQNDIENIAGDLMVEIEQEK